jgi:hypothetical protein
MAPKKKGYIPTMTSNTSPSPFVASANSYTTGSEPYRAFDNNIFLWQASGTNPNWLAINLGRRVSIWKYTLTIRQDYFNGYPIIDAPITWEIHGSMDGSNWDWGIDCHANVMNWTHGETKTFVFPHNSHAYQYYRIYITRSGRSINGGAFTDSTVCNLNGFQIYKYEPGVHEKGYIPTMTSNTSPSPFVASADSTLSATVGCAYGAFGDGGLWHTSNVACPHWLKIKLDKGVSIWKYTLTIRQDYTNGYPNLFAPMTWTIQGSNDDSTWEIINSCVNVTNWVHGETRNFILPQSSKKYLYYRFYCTKTGGSTNGSAFGEIKYSVLDGFQLYEYGR